MRRGALALGAAVSLCAAVSTSDAAGATERFGAADLFSLQYASDPQVRPDGREVAYVRISFDATSDRSLRTIWIVDVMTGRQVELGEPGKSSHSPRWSRDGSRLAYLSSEGEGPSQIHVRAVDTARTARITALPESPADLSWSADGRFIAFIVRTPEPETGSAPLPVKPEGARWAEPPRMTSLVRYRSDAAGYVKSGHRHVFVVPAEGGVARQITSGPYDDEGPVSWSADSRFLYLSSNPVAKARLEPLESEIYSVSVSDGALTQLTYRRGPDRAPRVSPDGSKIAYLGFDDRELGYQNVRLHVMDPDGRNARSLTDSLDRSIDAAEWAADGRSVYVQYTDAAVGVLARVFLDSRVQVIARGLGGSALDRPYTGGEFSASVNDVIAFTLGGADHPPDLSVIRRGGLKRLTRLNDSLFASRSLGSMRPLAVTSSADGRAVPSWLVVPPDFDPKKRYPLILEIHGGPFLSSYGPLFSTDHQLFAAAGYIVLYCNPRGSTSYGEEFANLIHRAYPGEDYDDLMSAVDAAIAMGFVNADRLYVTGASGGGLLTAWIVGRTSRFRAAAPQKAMVNWASMALTTDMYPTISRYWFGAFPWEDPQLFWTHSPLSLVGDVTTPTMMVVGELDYRTPVTESEQFYQAMQLRGVPSALLIVPGASHGSLTSRPSQSAARVNAILSWFQRF